MNARDYVKITINDTVYEPDSIGIAWLTEKDPDNPDADMAFISGGFKGTELIYAISLYKDSAVAGIQIGFEYMYGRRILNLLGNPIKVECWNYDSTENKLSTKFSFDYDDLDMGKGHAEFEIINVYHQTNYPHPIVNVDTTREYPAAGFWKYAGYGTTKDLDLSNLEANVQYPFATGILLDTFPLDDFWSDIFFYKYDSFIDWVAGAFDGAWQYNSDSSEIKTYWEPDEYPYYGYPFEKDATELMNNILKSKNYSVEKEHNLLKLFYNNKQNVIVFYKSPGDTLYSQHKKFILNTKNHENQKSNYIYFRNFIRQLECSSTK